MDLGRREKTPTPKASSNAQNGRKMSPPPPSNGVTNNNSLPKEVSVAELELLKKLEEANR